MNRKLNAIITAIILILCVVICYLQMGYIKVFLFGLEIGLATYNILLNIADIIKTNKQIKMLNGLMKELEKELGKSKKDLEKEMKTLNKKENSKNENPTCCLCGKKCENEYGNNPDPLSKSGKCCNKCNEEKVIPERLKRFNERFDDVINEKPKKNRN